MHDGEQEKMRLMQIRLDDLPRIQQLAPEGCSVLAVVGDKREARTPALELPLPVFQQ